MVAVVFFSAMVAKFLKFNERITWPFSKRRAADVILFVVMKLLRRLCSRTRFRAATPSGRRRISTASPSKSTLKFGNLAFLVFSSALGPRVDSKAVGRAVRE